MKYDHSTTREKWFETHRHEYVETGGVWSTYECKVCGLHKYYHKTRAQIIRGKILDIAIIVVIFLGVCGMLFGLRAVFYDGTPQVSEHQKCINDDGTWVRAEDGWGYCILDGRVK